jgi:N-acetylmuramoyl-L-alanine amidase CwlA
MTAQYITIHNTGNSSSNAAGERAWLTSGTNDRTASFHIVVDEKESVECLPLDEVGWHAGDGDGPGNRQSIGVEICESGDQDKTLFNAAEVVAGLLHARGWTVDRLRRHYDWSGKICPRLMYNNGTWSGWDRFRRMVKVQLLAMQKPDIPVKEEPKMKVEDANKVTGMLGQVYNLAVSAGARKADLFEIGRLADEVRVAAGLPKQN